MNLLPREIEERYGTAHGLLIPALVSPAQLDILKADEKNAAKVWHLPIVLYAGARVICQVQPSTGYLRPLQFNIPNDILDLEDFDNTIKDMAITDYSLELELGHYLLMAQITFMVDSPEGEDGGTSSRTMHLFTAHTRNLEQFMDEAAASPDLHLKLVKPTELNASLEAEWSEVKARRNTAPPGYRPNLLTDYNDAWVFVYTRLIAQTFHQLFGWPLPEI